MNSKNAKDLFISIVVIVALLAGCATTQPIPPMSHAQSSGLAIQLTLLAPINLFSQEPDQVYFVKIDNQDGLLQQRFIRSNFVNDGRAYLLNAQPGTYAAVGALFLDVYHRRYTTYFSKELVEQSKVTVPENDFVFMGSYLVQNSTEFEDADEIQTHYKNVISPGESTGSFSMGFGGPVHYLGALREIKNDEQTREEFLRRAKEDLTGNEWAARIR